MRRRSLSPFSPFAALSGSLLLLLLLAASGCGYNTIQTYDEQAARAKQDIEVQLQRRADLIPNLVETVKGYAKQESDIFIEVARAQQVLRGALSRPGGTSAEELAQANEQVSRSLVPVFAFAQSFPQLKSDQQFLRLQDELTGTENRIAVSRQDYNTAVEKYNTYIRNFPAAITAKATGAKPREYFRVTNSANLDAPKVDFGTKASPSATPPPATTPAAGGAAGTPTKP